MKCKRMPRVGYGHWPGRYLPVLALLRSTVPEGSEWKRLTNFLVSRPSEVS